MKYMHFGLFVERSQKQIEKTTKKTAITGSYIEQKKPLDFLTAALLKLTVRFLRSKQLDEIVPNTFPFPCIYL